MYWPSGSTGIYNNVVKVYLHWVASLGVCDVLAEPV